MQSPNDRLTYLWQEQKRKSYWRIQTTDPSIAQKLKRRKNFTLAGYGMNKLLIPILLISAVMGGVVFWFSSSIEPMDHREFRFILKKVATLAVTSEIVEGSFKEDFYGMTLYTEQVNYKDKLLEHVVVYDRRDPKNPIVIIADRGEIVRGEDVGKSEFVMILNFYDGRIIRENADMGHHQSVKFKKSSIQIRLDQFFHIPTAIPATIQIGELMACGKKVGDRGTECRIEFHRRASLAGACIAFALLAFVMGISVRKSANSRSLLLSLL